MVANSTISMLQKWQTPIFGVVVNFLITDGPKRGHGSGIRRNVNKLGGDNISHFGLIKAKTTSSLFSETILNTNILMVPY